MEDDLQWKRPQNIISGIYPQLLIESHSNFKPKHRLPNHILQIFTSKTTYNGRRPQNIKNGISQQKLIGSNSNFKLKLR